MTEKYICLDVGTTTVRCLILDADARILGSAFEKVQLLYPTKGRTEINPEWLWKTIISVVRASLFDAKIGAEDVKSMGICTLRNTFITWRKDNEEPLHNFITWKDVRCSDLVQKWNKSASLKMIRASSYLIYLFTRNRRYLAGSRVELACNHVTSRFLWVLDNIPNVREELTKDNVMFGTVDTWLIYKLTRGATYVTDISNAASTGLFDPFTLSWGSWAKYILGIPIDILPPVVENDYKFGVTNVFGHSIKISTVLADQSAAALGSCAFNKNDLKITLGTGAFVDLNTGQEIDCSFDGMYPTIGWKLQGNLVYLTEGPCNDCGSLVEWLQNSGFIKDIDDISRIIKETEDTEGLFFVPAFSGLGFPFNDEKAATGFIGVQPTTTRDQMVLAVLESITYRVGLTYQAINVKTRNKIEKIRVDGGVSRNDLICQMISDLTQLEVERAEFQEIAIMGLLFACGVSDDAKSNLKQLNCLRTIQKTFKPRKSTTYHKKMETWLQAAKRFTLWNS